MRAEREIEELENAIAYLELKPELYKRLSRAAKRRRNYQSRSAGYRWAAAAIMVLGAAALIYGVVSLVCRGFSGGYLLLCLLAAVFLFGGWRLLPTARNNNAAVLRGDKQARVQMQNYIDRFPAFPLPARYAHPIVLRRMQQAIAEGHALNVMEALEVVKADLQTMNADMQVSQEEYAEISTIKPLFLNADYK